MIGIYLGLGLTAIAGLFFFFLQRAKTLLAAENARLKDQLLEKAGDSEIAKLQDKLTADKVSGDKDEEAYRAWRAAHPELFPPRKS